MVRDFGRALVKAKHCDETIASHISKGTLVSFLASRPLFGVPMTVKESNDVAGLPTTRGYVALKGSIATKNENAVNALILAGAIIIGKTNVPQNCADHQSYNDVYGRTTNPYSALHTPGGSSGGSAAALAAGFTVIELGSDIGGSIRLPAAFCGVYGHKPTHSLIQRGERATSYTKLSLDYA